MTDVTPSHDGYEHLNYESILKELDTTIPLLQAFHANMKDMVKYVETGSDISAKARIVDSVRDAFDKLNLIKIKTKTLSSLSEDICTVQTKIVDTHKRNIEEELRKLQEPLVKKDSPVSMPFVGSWAEAPLDDDTMCDVSPQSWTTVVKGSNRKANPPSPSRYKFSSDIVNDGKMRWCTMTVPICEVEACAGGLVMRLMTVDTTAQLRKLPPGMMVYNRGLAVPKIVLTTGRENCPAVPLGCGIWDHSDNSTMIKFSQFNQSIQTDFSPNYESFYINEETARKLNIDEDETRNFRHPNKKGGNGGYTVYRCHNFGDARHLSEQYSQVSTADTADLYQYALWMLFVSLGHYNTTIRREASS